MATVPASSRATAVKSKATSTTTLKAGLKVAAEFCPGDVKDPFETVDWEPRTAVIKDENGQPLFEQNDCMMPT